MGKVCDSYCHKCVYCIRMMDAAFMCNYIFQAHKIRPCDPGTGCTVRVTDNSKEYKVRKKRKKESK